jgi:NAD(P)-dependent dehydrogenase (short-subunit alcohol dehydrogenase family)
MRVEQESLALVTGANRGIGLEVCRQLASKGLRVVLASRDQKKGLSAQKDLAASGLPVVYHELDVADVASVERLRANIENEYGRLNVLVNNAGVYQDEGVSVFEVEEKTVHATLEVNLFGAFRMCRAFVPLMRQSGYGRIVNVTSGLGSFAEMKGATAAYRISKTALNALTCIVADEVRQFGIKANAGCPGWVRTEMGGSNAPRTVEEGADTIVWLATLPDDGPPGGCFRDRKPLAW